MLQAKKGKVAAATVTPHPASGSVIDLQQLSNEAKTAGEIKAFWTNVWVGFHAQFFSDSNFTGDSYIN